MRCSYASLYGVAPGNDGNKSVMQIEDAAGKLPANGRRQNPHIPGQHDVIDVVPSNSATRRSLSGFAFASPMWCQSTRNCSARRAA